MPLDPNLVDLMVEEVVLEPATGLDKFNNFIYGDPVTVRCKIVRMNVRALERDGRELTSTVQVFLADPDMTVTANDRMTLPDGSRPAIVDVRSAYDESGPYYLEIRA